MTSAPAARFELASLGNPELIELASRLRRCADDGPHDFTSIGRTLLDTFRDSLVERTPPAVAFTRIFRVVAGELVLVVSRGMDQAWDDVTNSHSLFESEGLLSHLRSELRVDGSVDFADAPGVVFIDVTEMRELSELHLRYGVRSLLACGGRLPDESGYIMTVFARTAIAKELVTEYGTIALSVGIALSQATDLTDSPALATARCKALGTLLAHEERVLLDKLASVTGDLETVRREASALTNAARQESAAHAKVQERAQRAMLNVIEDLREAREDLERRVTDRTLELQRSNEELRSTNIELEQFAYVASHDLQEPLRTIAGYVQLLRERYGDRLDAEGHEFIDYTIRGAERMQELIDALLQYSRVARSQLSGGIVALDGALDDAIQALARAIADSHAQLERDPLPTIRGDRVLLRQLFQNLLSNAIKFAGESPPHIEIRCEHRDDAIVLRVRDHGIGFDPKYSEQVFRVFRRLQRKLPGTGIGLAICKKIVERHGGTIEAQALPGQGATFQVTLPRTEVSA